MGKLGLKIVVEITTEIVTIVLVIRGWTYRKSKDVFVLTAFVNCTQFTT